MSSQKSSRQSPPPERQSGPQIGAPSGGKARGEQVDQSPESQTSGLSSNPVGPLDQAARDKASKPGEKNLDGL